MTPTVDDVFQAALSLPSDSRATLAAKLLDSLEHAGQTEIDAAWAVEIDRRLRAYDSGEMKSVPGSEVFRLIRERRKT